MRGKLCRAPGMTGNGCGGGLAGMAARSSGPWETCKPCLPVCGLAPYRAQVCVTVWVMLSFRPIGELCGTLGFVRWGSRPPTNHRPLREWARSLPAGLIETRKRHCTERSSRRTLLTTCSNNPCHGSWAVFQYNAHRFLLHRPSWSERWCDR